MTANQIKKFSRFALLGFITLYPQLLIAQQVIRLQPDEVAIIGYGSLVNQQSMERSLNRRYTGPVVNVNLIGWTRAWNVGMPNSAFYQETAQGRVMPERIVYLNIQRAPEARAGAVLFVIKRSELESFNRREWIYDPVSLPANELEGVRVEGGQVIAYVGKPEYFINPNDQFPRIGVRRTYIEGIDRALRQYSPVLYRQFSESISPIAPIVFPDQQLPQSNPFGYRNQRRSLGEVCVTFFRSVFQRLVPATP